MNTTYTVVYEAIGARIRPLGVVCFHFSFINHAFIYTVAPFYSLIYSFLFSTRCQT